MEKRANHLALADIRYVKLTNAEVRTIYAVFIDRYEHLNMVLRSLPTPQEREQAAAEQAVVITIINHICGPYADPFLAESASMSKLASAMPRTVAPGAAGARTQ